MAHKINNRVPELNVNVSGASERTNVRKRERGSERDTSAHKNNNDTITYLSCVRYSINVYTLFSGLVADCWVGMRDENACRLKITTLQRAICTTRFIYVYVVLWGRFFLSLLSAFSTMPHAPRSFADFFSCFTGSDFHEYKMSQSKSTSAETPEYIPSEFFVE